MTMIASKKPAPDKYLLIFKTFLQPVESNNNFSLIHIKVLVWADSFCGNLFLRWMEIFYLEYIFSIKVDLGINKCFM